MKKYKIFVSGVQKELAKERQAVRESIQENILLREHFTVFLFEDYPAQGSSASKIYLDQVTKSDIYIGILGNEYGNRDLNGLSVTEREFRTAQNKNKEILIFVKGKDDTKRDSSLRKLISEIKKPDRGYKYKRFEDVADLKTNIFESLVRFMGEKNIIGKTFFDMAICEDATYKDIDEEKVRWFLRSAKAERNYPLDENTPLKDAFTHLNLLKENKLTNAAILLFGKNPQKFFPQAEVKCLRFHGTEIEKPFESYQKYKGNIFEQIDRALGFVLDALTFSVVPQHGKAADKRDYEIPEFAIKEAIVNAVAHRDYFSSAGVQVMVFIDRIEIWNSGELPPQLTVETLKRPHSSYPHNPIIAEPLYLANYIQKTGFGTYDMVRQCKTYGLPEPEFMQERGQFTIKIWKNIFTDSYISALGLNERQVKAVKYIKEKKRVTNKEYQGLNKCFRNTASNDLADLVRKGIFKPSGKKGKGAFYIFAH